MIAPVFTKSYALLFNAPSGEIAAQTMENGLPAQGAEAAGLWQMLYKNQNHSQSNFFGYGFNKDWVATPLTFETIKQTHYIP